MRPAKPALKSLTGDGEPGVSLVTCCRNRSVNLKIALSSWLKHEDISEIVIVDWSSDIPLRCDLEDFIDADERVRVVRVEEEKSWILTYAYNTGFRCASHECILKADADIVLNPDFFQANKLRKGEFLTGNWRIVPEDQAHINGFFLTRKSDLANAGGFNEFITAYGWDDDDLYGRLTANGLKRRDIDPDTIHHLPHDDEARSEVFKSDEVDKVATVGEQIRKSPQFGIRRNYYIAALMPAWSRQHQMASFSVVDQQNAHPTMKRLDAGGNEVPQTVKDEADYFALKDMVNWNHGLSASTDRITFFSLMSGSFSDLEAFVETLSKQSVKAWLYHKFQWRWLQPTVANATLGKPSISVPRPKLYIDAQHGLGNRLRAIASGAAIARATDRELVIIWEADSHCECQFGDLYDYEGAVMGRSFSDEAAARGVDFVTYMELEANSRKHKPIRLREGADFYARTAYVLNSSYTSDEAENEFLQRLQPVEAVLDLVSSVRSPNDVAAHVRMTGGAGFEHLAYETSDNWNKRSHKKIGHWRQKSHFSNFMKRIDRLASEKQAERIFLAADQPETYIEFQERYGARVAFLPRELYDRSTEQLIYALADALLLGRAPLLLGSTWSSFSELAIRLSAQNIEVEMSGKDF